MTSCNGLSFFGIFYILPGLLATGLIYVIAKAGFKLAFSLENIKWLQYVKLALFNILCFYFVQTAIKTVTGNGYLTYSNTIENAVAATYRHYLIIDAVVLMLLVFGMTVILKKWTIPFAERSLSVCLGILLPLIVFHGRGPLNIEFFYSFLLGLIVGTVFEILPGLIPAFDGKISGKASAFVTKVSAKNRLKIWLPVGIMCALFHYFFTPLQLYYGNVNEFRIRGFQLGLISMIPIIAAIIVSTAVMMLLSANVFKMTTAAVFGITVMKYIQGVALNGSMQSMQGFSQTWGDNSKLVNNIIWAAVIVAVFLTGIFVKKAVKYYSIACIYISLIFVATIGYLAFTTKAPEQIGLTADGCLEVNPNNNTLVFLLDKYDTQYFSRVTEENPELLDSLCDFTYYPNITSAWTYTDRSLPFLLSGEKGLTGVTPTESREYAYGHSDILENYEKAGYTLEVYTDPWYVVWNVASHFRNFDGAPELECNIPGYIRTALRMAQYSSMPFSLKGRYTYSDMDCLTMADFTGVWKDTDDTIFWGMLNNEGLSVRDDGAKGAFKFFHMIGAHEPYRMDENCERVEYSEDELVSASACDAQAKGALKVVDEYLRQLKELGLYDNATIIICADHGQSYAMDKDSDYTSRLKVNDTCVPLCLVKLPGEHNDIMKVNDVAVTQQELNETMQESITHEKIGDRKRLDEVVEGDYIERETIRVDQVLGEAMCYTIKGDARDPKSWESHEADFDVIMEK